MKWWDQNPTATTLIHTIIFPHPLYFSNDFLVFFPSINLFLLTTQEQGQLDCATMIMISSKKSEANFSLLYISQGPASSLILPNPSSSNWSEWPSLKSLQIINAGENVEKKEPSYTSGGECKLVQLIQRTVWQFPGPSLVAQMVEKLPAMWETLVWSLGWEDPLEEGMATHSSILAWRIPKDRGAWGVIVHRVTKSWT